MSLRQSRARSRTVRFLGTRGVPATHGGFETAVENVGRLLIERGWRVITYCQVEGTGAIVEDTWHGIERVIIPVSTPGARGTMVFDGIAARHAAKREGISLVFGYNTALMNVLQRAAGSPLIFNMDGIEWRRERWGLAERAFLYLNERIATKIGLDLIADHPQIETYLQTRAVPSKITMIPYGANAVDAASEEPVRRLGLTPARFCTLICRPVPDNSILELVRGFSAWPRGVKLAVLGDYDRSDEYHRRVMDAASDEVVFLGAIYDSKITEALRFHSLAYLHGHTVGGTNPSLVEALAAGNPVIAHDNAFNRWVAGKSGRYFRTDRDVDNELSALIERPELADAMSQAARARHAEGFTWQQITDQYERLLSRHVEADQASLTSADLMEI